MIIGWILPKYSKSMIQTYYIFAVHTEWPWNWEMPGLGVWLLITTIRSESLRILIQALGTKRKNKTTTKTWPRQKMQHRWRELFFRCLHVFVFGFSGFPNHDVFFVLCFVESFGRRWLYWFSGVQSDVGTSAASGLIFFAQKNTREDISLQMVIDVPTRKKPRKR